MHLNAIAELEEIWHVQKSEPVPHHRPPCEDCPRAKVLSVVANSMLLNLDQLAQSQATFE